MFTRVGSIVLTDNTFIFKIELDSKEYRFNSSEELIKFISKSNNRDSKIIAVGTNFGVDDNDLFSRLWLEEDIVPINYSIKNSDDLINLVKDEFDEYGIPQMHMDESNEMKIAELVNLDDYKRTTDKEVFEEFIGLAERMKDKRVIFISSTPRGGGVALMRHALIRLFKLVGLEDNIKWHVLTPDARAFLITKRKFHNILQNVANSDSYLTEDDKEHYLEWIESNAKILKRPITESDIIIIDDPQPSGLIPFIKEWNPNAKLLYRSHIQIEADLVDKDGTNQNRTWDFIWKFAKHAEKFIAHPINEFVPSVVTKNKLEMMPATTDHLDGLNKDMTNVNMEYYENWFNQILNEQGFSALDFDKPYLVQVARFDPSKGIHDLIESYQILTEMLSPGSKDEIPQLVITGHGSVDDPDGEPIFNMIMQTLDIEKYRNIADKIKVARLPHNDQLLNTVMSKSLFALQLSHKEGFEIKVTEALMKGKPVISYNAGGIPLQIESGKTGIIVDKVGDCRGVAKAMYKLVSDKDFFREMSTNARNNYRKDVLTIPNAIRWMRLFLDERL